MDVACKVTTSVVLVVCSEVVVSKDVALRIHSNCRLNIAWDISHKFSTQVVRIVQDVNGNRFIS